MGKKRDKLPMENYQGGRELAGCMDSLFELMSMIAEDVRNWVFRGRNKKEDESDDSPSE